MDESKPEAAQRRALMALDKEVLVSLLLRAKRRLQDHARQVEISLEHGVSVGRQRERKLLYEELRRTGRAEVVEAVELARLVSLVGTEV